MRFINGPIPASRTFDPVAAGWTPLRAHDDRRFAAVAMLCSIPIVLGATILFLHGAPALRTVFRLQPWSLPCVVVLLVALVPVHEFVHALAYRCGLRSPNLVAGIWLRRGLAYVLCDEPLQRRRVLVMVAAPFCGLTVLPLLMASFLSGPLLTCVLFFSLLHTALCTGDAATFLGIWRQVPPQALIHNQGWRTYWALPKERFS